MDDCAFDQERLAATEALIRLVEDAILQLSTGTVQSYEIDDSQTKIRKTFVDAAEARLMLKELDDRRSRYALRVNGGGVTRMVPGF